MSNNWLIQPRVGLGHVNFESKSSAIDEIFAFYGGVGSFNKSAHTPPSEADLEELKMLFPDDDWEAHARLMAEQASKPGKVALRFDGYLAKKGVGVSVFDDRIVEITTEPGNRMPHFDAFNPFVLVPQEAVNRTIEHFGPCLFDGGYSLYWPEQRIYLHNFWHLNQETQKGAWGPSTTAHQDQATVSLLSPDYPEYEYVTNGMTPFVIQA